MSEKLNNTNNSYKPTNTDKSLLSLVFDEDKDTIDENICPHIRYCIFIFVLFILFLLIFFFLNSFTIVYRVALFIFVATFLYFLLFNYLDEENDA